MVSLKGISVCSNFNSLVYVQGILARKAFCSTGSLKTQKQAPSYTSLDRGLFSTPVSLPPNENKTSENKENPGIKPSLLTVS